MRKIVLTLLSLLFLSSVYGQLVEGFIIDQYGGKYEGSMNISRTETSLGAGTEQSETLIYKEGGKGKKEKLTVKDLSAFKMGEDSFLVLRNFQLPLDNIKYNKFARVLLKEKKVLLCSFEEVKFMPTSTNSSVGMVKKTIPHYLIYRNGNFVSLTDYNFYQEMPSVIDDHKKLKSDVESKKLSIKDIEELAAEYERWRKNGKPN